MKIKWDNLKKDAKKVSKNLLDAKHNEFDDVTSQVVTLMYEAENNGNGVPIEQAMDFGEDLNGMIQVFFIITIILSLFTILAITLHTYF